MLTALKWSGTSITVGSLEAAITVRVIAGGAAVVCAAPEAGSAIAPSNSSPVVLNCMIASQVRRIIGAPYALPAPLGMAGRFELLLDGNGRCPGSHHLRGSFQNRSVFRSIEASCRIKPPAHNHPTSEYVTVLSGDFCFGMETNSTPSAAGSLRKWT